MGELGELHEKINTVDKNVVKIQTTLDLSLPKLATDESVELAIANHSADCKGTKRSLTPARSSSAKKIAALITATAALTSAVLLVLQFLFGG